MAKHVTSVMWAVGWARSPRRPVDILRTGAWQLHATESGTQGACFGNYRRMIQPVRVTIEPVADLERETRASDRRRRRILDGKTTHPRRRA